jgi:hypothetical protein
MAYVCLANTKCFYIHIKKDDPSDLKALVMSPEVGWCVRCDRSGDRILQHYATFITPPPLFLLLIPLFSIFFFLSFFFSLPLTSFRILTL